MYVILRYVAERRVGFAYATSAIAEEEDRSSDVAGNVKVLHGSNTFPCSSLTPPVR